MELDNFTISEFDSPDVVGSGENMDTSFLELLDKARDIADVSFKINSGYRTKEHNKKVGGVSGSSHLKGFAADIHCTESSNRFKILAALLEVGFQRIGIGKTFIHVDNDPDKNPVVAWMY